MDRWPGAYPETPTPQQHLQEPQYPAQQQPQGQPHGGLGEQPTEAPSHQPLATEVKPHDITAGRARTNSGAGLSNAEYHRLQARTLEDERNPSVDEAVGGGTYVRENEPFPSPLGGQPKRNEQHEPSGQAVQAAQAAWPLSNVSVQHEQQPRQVHQYHPDEAQREVREAGEPHQAHNLPQQSADDTLSHGHQPSDLPVAYQQHARDVPQQAHPIAQQSQGTQHQPHASHGVVDLGRGHEPSNLSLAYQQNTLAQRSENLPQPSRSVQQQDTRSQQPQGVAHEDDSHSRAKQGLAAGALAGAGLAGYEHSRKHDEPLQQSRAQQPQAGATGLDRAHQPSHIPVASQQHTRETTQQPHDLGHQSRAVHQQPQPAASHSLSRGHQSSSIPDEYQQNTQSQQPRDDHSHSRAEKGLAAGALAGAGAGAGVAAHEYSSQHQQPHELRHESRELSQQPHQAEPQSTRRSQSGAGSRDQTSTSSTPPYWGSLPTAATGGIYNTVTGHGSAREDHGQHRSLSPTDRTAEEKPADATIPIAATAFPTGGVYNSVTGHGSGDDHSKQNGSDASRMPLLGAGQSRNVQDTAGYAQSSGAGPTNVQRGTDATGPLHGSSTVPSHSHDAGTHAADRSTYGEAGTQRAFPLTTSDVRDAHHGDKSHSTAEKGLAAGALAGAGVAAYEHSGKHDQQPGRDSAEMARSHGQGHTYGEQHATQGHPAQQQTRKLEKRTSPDDKEKHKENHGLIGGIVGKHDVAEGREPTAEHRTDPAATEHRLVESHPQAAAISPPNAREQNKEHHGLLKHGSDEGRSSRDIAPIPGTHPAENRAAATQAQAISPANAEAKRTSMDGRDSPKKKEHHGVFGIFHLHKDDKKEEEPKEHRRSGSIERHNTLKKSPPPKVAAAMRASTPPKESSIEEPRLRQVGAEEHSGHKGALATGAGAAAGGIAASELVHRHAENQDTSRQTTSRDAAQDNYSRETSSGHSGAYNTLADGTPSGIATSRATQHDTSSSAPHNTLGSNPSGQAPEKSDQHHGLQTGTGAGLAAGAGTAGLYAASRDTKRPEQYDNRHANTNSPGAFSSTAQTSSAAAGDDNWRSELPPTVATSRATDPSTAYTTTTHDQLASHHTTSQTTTTGTAPHDRQPTSGTTTGPYDTLESGTASGVATGGATATGAAAAHGATASYGTSHTEREAPLTERHYQDAGSSKGGDLPHPYNVLPSGTPSGVNIEYRRRSKEMERRE